MSYKDHAKREFFVAGWTDEKGEFKDDMQKMLCEQVLELLDLFSDHGHSGTTAPYAVDLFQKLAAFKLIMPLTGKDDEWCDLQNGCGDSMQNKRLSSVFKLPDGRAYDIDGRLYWEWFKDETGEVSKSYFSKGGDLFYIEFPYTQQKPVVEFCPTDEFPHAAKDG